MEDRKYYCLVRVVLFTLLKELVITIKFVDQILKSNHSNRCHLLSRIVFLFLIFLG